MYLEARRVLRWIGFQIEVTPQGDAFYPILIMEYIWTSKMEYVRGDGVQSSVLSKEL